MSKNMVFCKEYFAFLLLIVVFAELGKAKLGVVLKHPTNRPLACKDKQILASEVLHPLGIVRES